MKKILLCATALFCLNATIMALKIVNSNPHGITNTIYEPLSFGRVVKFSDIAGFGEIIEINRTNVFIQVDTPLLGCTNNQVITLYRSLYSRKPIPETGRIVFAAHTNQYTVTYACDWNEDMSGHDIFRSRPLFSYNVYKGWFYPETEEAIFFTNIIHTMRVGRNWTNYYEVVRSGFPNESYVISDSAEEDLKNLILHNSSPDAYGTLLYMSNDPLFPESLKPLLNEKIQEQR